MTRINVVSPEELSDQWLISEYRELPRCILTERVYCGDAPKKYCLGKGHVKWAIVHSIYLMSRYYYICEEMKHRGFKVNFPYDDLRKVAEDKQVYEYSDTYIPNNNDIQINKNRLIEKYNMKPTFYRWTNREKPKWLKGIL